MGRRPVPNVLGMLVVDHVDMLAGPDLVDKAVHIDDGERLNSGLTISAASFGVPDLAADRGLPVNP